MLESSKKYLIVNADDFGLSRGICDGVVEVLRQGFVSDVSLVANGAAFDYGVSRLKAEGVSACGVHLCFVDGELPLTDVPPFLLENGCFLANRYKFLFQTLRPGSLSFLERELRAQIERILQAGLKVSHVDGHQHLHIFPGISEIVLKLCLDYQIPFVRLPVADKFSPLSAVLNSLSRRMKRLSEKNTVRYPVTLGFGTGGRLTRPDIARYLEDAASSSNTLFELITHPGSSDDATRQRYAHWGYDWQAEKEALGILTVEYLQSKNISLISFSEAARHELSDLPGRFAPAKI